MATRDSRLWMTPGLFQAPVTTGVKRDGLKRDISNTGTARLKRTVVRGLFDGTRGRLPKCKVGQASAAQHENSPSSVTNGERSADATVS